MTILWCGGEDIDFINGDTTMSNETPTEYARKLIAGTTGASPPLLPGITSGWAHTFFVTGIQPVNIVLGLVDHNTRYGIVVYIENTGKLSIKKYGASVSTLATASDYCPGGGVGIDLQVIDYGNNATVNVYQGGSLAVTYSGDIAITGITSLNSLIADSRAYSTVSEFIIADEDTRLMRLKTLAPNAAGDTSTNWTGAYTDIDETTLSDADKIYSATNNADFQTNLTGMPSGTWTVKAVKIAARCVDGSGTTGIQLGVKSGGTITSGDTQTASGYWQTKERLMQVNPVTGVAFTPAEIEALQVNLRAVTL